MECMLFLITQVLNVAATHNSALCTTVKNTATNLICLGLNDVFQHTLTFLGHSELCRKCYQPLIREEAETQLVFIPEFYPLMLL